MSRRTIAVFGVVVVLASALAACAADPASSPTTPAAASSPAIEPEPTEPAPPAPETAVVPSDCADVGTAETRAATVDQLELQGDGTGFERPVPPDAILELGCDWFAGDATGVLLLISRVDAAAAAQFIPTLEADGFTCTTGDAGNPVCQKTTPNSEYPVDTVETIVSHDDIWIYMSASNVDGDALLSDLNQQIWG